MATPLDDISILDLSLGPAGGLATMVLGDFGAQVIKVEPPGGDPFRKLPSSPMWLRGKKSITLDLGSESAIEALQRLVAATDVVVTGQRSVNARAQGCDYETLSRINPRLIYCQITGFGDQGPYAHFPAYEGVVSAKAGRMKEMEGIIQTPGPVYAAVQVATHATSQNVLSGILAALIERGESGMGQMLQTSLLQGLMPYDQGGSLWRQLMARNPNPPSGGKHDPSKVMPNFNYHPVQAGDGKWLQLANLMPHHFERFLRVADLDKELEKTPYNEPMHTWSAETREGFRNILLRRMQQKGSDEWMKLFIDDGGVAAHPYLTAEEALDDPDMVQNGHVITLAGIRQLGPLARLTETPAEIHMPAPEPGQHNDLIESIGPLKTGADPGPVTDTQAPLAGITVLEFAAIIATPLGTSFLADMGARVIKVEPVEGDPFRAQSHEVGAARVNNGKESITIDLKTDTGQAIAYRLIKRADILIHNYRPGVPERLGITYDEARKLNPEIIYLAANGYGPMGPGVSRPSAHPIPGAAMGGAMYQAGGIQGRELLGIEELRETSRRLGRANEVNPDPNTAMVVCSAALLGLYAKQRTGKGQRIFIDMLGANAYANFDDFLQYEGKPERPPLGSELRGPHPLYRLYPCKEGWIFLGLLLDQEWVEFCKTANRPDLLDDPAFSSEEMRDRNQTALSSELSALFSTKTAVQWESIIGSQGLGCVVADSGSMAEFFLGNTDSQDDSWMVPVSHTRWGEYFRHGPMVAFSRSRCTLKGAVLAGEHTDTILEELGYSTSEILALRKDHVVSAEKAES